MAVCSAGWLTDWVEVVLGVTLEGYCEIKTKKEKRVSGRASRTVAGAHMQLS